MCREWPLRAQTSTTLSYLRSKPVRWRVPWGIQTAPICPVYTEVSAWLITLHLNMRYWGDANPSDTAGWTRSLHTSHVLLSCQHNTTAPHLIFSCDFFFSLGLSKIKCYYFYIIKAKTVSLSLKLFYLPTTGFESLTSSPQPQSHNHKATWSQSCFWRW